MESFLKPARFETKTNSVNAAQEWNHWYTTFQNFISLITDITDSKKLKLLINFLSPSVYEHIRNCDKFDEAVEILNSVYIKPVNEVYARHKLAHRTQLQGETIDQYLEALKLLSNECNFKAVTADVYKDEYIRDAFISGLNLSYIRQRLLEKSSISLQEAFELARSLELSVHQSKDYTSSNPTATVSTLNIKQQESSGLHASQQSSKDLNHFNPNDVSETALTASVSKKCFFCGNNWHTRNICPAKNVTCNNCGKTGHFGKVCKSSVTPKPNRYLMSHANSIESSLSSAISGSTSLSNAIVQVKVNDNKTSGLIDTGSTTSFICDRLVEELDLNVEPTACQVKMASTSFTSMIKGFCRVKLELLDHLYPNVQLFVLSNLCSNIIIGHDLLTQHSSLKVNFGGRKAPLNICALAAANVKPATLFTSLSPDCKPVSIKSRRHSIPDYKFIRSEIQNLLKEGVIEPSNSPWRAQALVTQSENHKRRMVVDYSRTINRFTDLDAYPIPYIEDIIQKVAEYNVFSTLDLRSAYHQVPILESDEKYTAFEACGQLYQFKRIPFGVTNGVAAFQRVIDDIIRTEGLKDTYAYLDDVTICGKTQADHDNNLRRFMNAVNKYNLTVNQEKSRFSLTTINILGYTIQDHVIKPDADRLKPLKGLDAPKDTASLRRCLGMFAHYSKYIRSFSEKLQPLINCKFPLSAEALDAFEKLKTEICNAAVTAIDRDGNFTVETDASDFAIAATLSQEGKPVAFFSRTLAASEQRHSSIEKEAYAIVEALRKWRHYLLGKPFKLITDQRSVSFMFDNKSSGKIKNEKISRWRLELSCYKYDIIYRPGKENIVADALSRNCSALMTTTDDLFKIHESLCHPGITRMFHWVKSKNLAFSLEDIKAMTSSCKICSEVKPRFFKHQGTLIKATSPFERLNIDFKGPLPSTSRHKYLLTVIDEFSRFPFAFACADLTSSTVIANLKVLFGIFGLPSYIHSDRGSSFMSQELKDFLTLHGVATSRTTPYNPQCNGQAERYNGTIWKTIELALKSRNLPITNWHTILSEALHSIRSLLCTATNTTPHERMFNHPRRSSNGTSIPSWLMRPGPVLLKNYVRKSKYDPVVQEVILLEANPEYAYVKMADGRETTVSTRHLAPVGTVNRFPRSEAVDQHSNNVPACHSAPTRSNEENLTVPLERQPSNIVPASPLAPAETNEVNLPLDGIPTDDEILDTSDPIPTIVVRRSSRVKQLPKHLQNYKLGGMNVV